MQLNYIGGPTCMNMDDLGVSRYPPFMETPKLPRGNESFCAHYGYP